MKKQGDDGVFKVLAVEEDECRSSSGAKEGGGEEGGEEEGGEELVGN